MKLRAILDERDCEVSTEEIDGRLRVTIDGRFYNLEVRKPEDNSYLLFNDSRVYDIRVEHKSRDNFEVRINRRPFVISIVDPRRLRTDENTDRHHHGPIEIAAQMPGKVVRVLVEPGAQVEKGAGIVVVEAMKMQNEIKTPRAGTVISVNVKPGNTVNAGEVLATVGEAEE